MQAGTYFGIYLGGATAPGAVVVTHVHVTVVDERPKAIKVQATREDGSPGGYCWLPKSGLKLWWDEGKYGKCYKLAAWFQRKMGATTASFLDRHAVSAGVSA